MSLQSLYTCTYIVKVMLPYYGRYAYEKNTCALCDPPSGQPWRNEHNYMSKSITRLVKMGSGKIFQRKILKNVLLGVRLLVWSVIKFFNLLTPSGFFTYHQVEHSKILHGARFALSVLYGYQNRATFALYSINWLVFITMVESVYCAVRTDSLYKADYVSSLKG